MSEGVDAGQLDTVQKAVAELMGPGLRRFKHRATYAVAGQLRTIMEREPPASHSPVIWASERQRRWYFAARRRDELPLKYTRHSDAWSQQSRKAWGITRGDTDATLGNRATYGAYVQSVALQTAQHAATGWTTDEQAAEQIIGDGTMHRIVTAHVRAIVREAFGGLG